MSALSAAGVFRAQSDWSNLLLIMHIALCELSVVWVIIIYMSKHYSFQLFLDRISGVLVVLKATRSYLTLENRESTMDRWSAESKENQDHWGQVMETFDPLHHSTPLPCSSLDIRQQTSPTQNSFLNEKDATAERVTTIMLKEYLNCSHGSLDFIDIFHFKESGPHTTCSLDFNDFSDKSKHLCLQVDLSQASNLVCITCCHSRCIAAMNLFEMEQIQSSFCHKSRSEQRQFLFDIVLAYYCTMSHTEIVHRRKTNKVQIACAWMENYFKRIGDKMPHMQQVHLPVSSQKSSCINKWLKNYPLKGTQTCKEFPSRFYAL